MTDYIPADKVREIIHSNTFQGEVMEHRRAAIVDQLKALLPLPTLADMTPEEREECVGMWCDLETNKGIQQVVLYKIGEDQVGPVAYRLSFTSRHEILGFDPKELTPRPDLPRAWNPDGTPVQEPRTSKG